MIAILGANGFIGRHVTQALSGHDLKLFARSFDDFPFPLPANTQHFSSDFSQPESYIHELEGCRAALLLVNTAFVRDTGHQQDTEAYKKFFDALVKLKNPPAHIIYLSSGGAVYGKTEAQPILETHPLKPLSTYGQNKADIEKITMEISKAGAFDYSILRVANPVGIWCKRKALIDSILNAVRGGPILKILGDGSMVRDYFDVRELAQAVALLLQKPGTNEIYNVGSGKGLTINDVVAVAQDVTGEKVPAEFILANAIDVPYNVLDCTKIEKAIDWRAKTELKEIVKIMWNAQ